jgi:nucleoid DNA-binding protein
MQELIDRLMKEAGLSADQASKAIQTIASFVKSKFPMLEGAVDQIFSARKQDEDPL